MWVCFLLNNNAGCLLVSYSQRNSAGETFYDYHKDTQNHPVVKVVVRKNSG